MVAFSSFVFLYKRKTSQKLVGISACGAKLKSPICASQINILSSWVPGIFPESVFHFLSVIGKLHLEQYLYVFSRWFYASLSVFYGQVSHLCAAPQSGLLNKNKILITVSTCTEVHIHCAIIFVFLMQSFYFPIHFHRLFNLVFSNMQQSHQKIHLAQWLNYWVGISFSLAF